MPPPAGSALRPHWASRVDTQRAAILHTIFFHRYFTPVTPLHRDLLDLTLPAIDDVDLETLIDRRATELVRAMETGAGHQQRGRSRRSANQSGYQSVCQSWQTVSHERASITRTPQNEESGHGACTGLCP